MLLDIGVGILAALGLQVWLHVPATAAWVWMGIAFALLPDIDALVNLVRFRSTRLAFKHRDLLHLPLVYIPFGTLILYVFNPSLAALFALCSLLHFVHDSIGIGWGVQWLWPLSTDHFSFLYLYQPAGKTPLPRRLSYRWPHASINSLDTAHGDTDWIHNIYVRLHPYALVELGIFLLALSVLYFSAP